MPITPQELRHVAHLARLEVAPDQEQALLDRLGGILAWMDQLNELDTTGVEPLTHVSPEESHWRDDVAQPPLPLERALRNAPHRDEAYFRVPKVL